MITLIQNAECYAPAALGSQQLLVAGSRIAAIAPDISLHGEQLQLLNSLLDEDRKAVVEEVRKERRDDGPRVTGTLFGGAGLEPVTSTLTGNLRGWSRGTVMSRVSFRAAGVGVLWYKRRHLPTGQPR